MAVLQSIQTGNFSDASTWAVVDATSYVDFRSAEQALSTTQTNASVAFTPGAITISGISLQIGTRVVTPTVTMTVRLFNNTAGSIVKDVTINVADLPNTNGTLNGSYIGWTYFKFDSDVTLIAGNQYSVRAFTSVSSSQVTVYRSATVNNWSKALVTTTTAAPASTDIFLTSGVYTSPGVNSIVTITMNNTSLVTQYGNCYVGSNGRFNYGTAPSTNYGLRLAGNIFVGLGAIFTIGTISNPIPVTSTAVLEINCASSIQFQIFNFGTFETKYETTVLHRALLNADISVGATTMSTNVSTGWKQNDVIVIPSTTRTTTQHERVTLNANAVGTTLTHSATSFAHDGNATIYIQADLANLTRNIKIRSVSAAARSRFLQGLNAVTTLFDVEFFQWTGCVHNSGTSTYAGSFNLQQCTFWGTTNTSTVFNNLNTSSNIISSNIFYNYVDATQTINNENIIIGFTGFAAWTGPLGNNNVISSCSAAGSSGPFNNSTGNRFYSTAGNGAIYTTGSPNSYTINNWVFFNNAVAIRFLGGTSTIGSDRNTFEIFENCYFYGNVTNFDSINGPTFRKLQFKNCFFWAGKTGLLTAIGYTPFTNDYIHFSNCTFGRRPDGVDSLFSTSCLRGGQVGTTLTNCLFYGITASFATVNTFTSVNGFNGVTSLKHNGITNEYRQFQSNGFIQNDNLITYNGLPTIRITPQVVTNKTFSNPVRVAVQSGQTCTISVLIRKSISSDNTIYNGNQPRLMYSYNTLAGNLLETIAVITINRFINAQNFETATWIRSGITLTDTILTTAPDGTFTADLFSEDTSTGRHRLSYNGITLPVGQYNLSIYAKKNTHDWIQLIPVSGVWNNENWANFNLNTGTIGNTGVGASASIISVGNGWYRLSLVCTLLSTGNDFPTVCMSINNTNSGRYPSYTGTSAQCFFVWGAQLTAGSDLQPYYDNGQWEPLTYTTPVVSHDSVLEFYIDCDGTTGWINIDDFKTTTTFNDTRGMNYWSSIGVYTEPDWSRPGGNNVFLN